MTDIVSYLKSENKTSGLDQLDFNGVNSNGHTYSHT